MRINVSLGLLELNGWYHPKTAMSNFCQGFTISLHPGVYLKQRNGIRHHYIILKWYNLQYPFSIIDNNSHMCMHALGDWCSHKPTPAITISHSLNTGIRQITICHFHLIGKTLCWIYIIQIQYQCKNHTCVIYRIRNPIHAYSHLSKLLLHVLIL